MSPSAVLDATTTGNGELSNNISAKALKNGVFNGTATAASNANTQVDKGDAVPEGGLCECKPLYQKKDKDGKSEHKKDKKSSKESEAAEEKSSALAGLNGKRCRPLKCLRADTMSSQFFARGSRQAEGACKRAQSCQA